VSVPIKTKGYKLYLPSKGELKKKLLEWTKNADFSRKQAEL